MVEHQHLTPALDRSVSLRRQVTSQAMQVFAGWGYREIQIPILDYFDSLKEGLDDRQVARSFRFVDRTGNLMVLQPDITPAIAKVYAYQLQGTPLPLRLSYANNVVHIERSLTGDQLESSQLGIELIGARGLVADVEVLLVAREVLEELGLENYQINVADHRTAKLLLSATGAPSRIRDEVRRAIIARDPDAVREILTGLGAREVYVEALAVLSELRDGAEQLATIRELLATHVKVLERLDYLRALERTIDELGYAENVRLDLGELGVAGPAIIRVWALMWSPKGSVESSAGEGATTTSSDASVSRARRSGSPFHWRLSSSFCTPLSRITPGVPTAKMPSTSTPQTRSKDYMLPSSAGAKTAPPESSADPRSDFHSYLSRAIDEPSSATANSATEK